MLPPVPRSTAQRQPRVGRPSLCTPQTIRTICDAIAAAMHVEQACQKAGISTSTFAAWRERAHEERLRIAAGRPDDITVKAWNDARKVERPYVEFLESLEAADLALEELLLATVMKAAVPHTVRRTTVRRQVLRENGRIVRTDANEIVYEDVTTVEEHEEVDWKAAMEMLRKRFAARYQDRIRAELTGAGGDPIRMEIPVQNADANALREVEDAFIEAGLMSEDDRTFK